MNIINSKVNGPSFCLSVVLGKRVLSAGELSTMKRLAPVLDRRKATKLLQQVRSVRIVRTTPLKKVPSKNDRPFALPGPRSHLIDEPQLTTESLVDQFGQRGSGLLVVSRKKDPWRKMPPHLTP